ncbi:MAG: hypothetical protein U0892_08835 [Pirellulales bacterium]
MAALTGRFSIDFSDVKRVAVPVLRHRISTNFQAQAEGMSSDKIVERLVKEIPEPPIPRCLSGLRFRRLLRTHRCFSRI